MLPFDFISRPDFDFDGGFDKFEISLDDMGVPTVDSEKEKNPKESVVNRPIMYALHDWLQAWL